MVRRKNTNNNKRKQSNLIYVEINEEQKYYL